MKEKSDPEFCLVPSRYSAETNLTECDEDASSDLCLAAPSPPSRDDLDLVWCHFTHPPSLSLSSLQRTCDANSQSSYLACLPSACCSLVHSYWLNGKCGPALCYFTHVDLLTLPLFCYYSACLLHVWVDILRCDQSLLRSLPVSHSMSPRMEPVSWDSPVLSPWQLDHSAPSAVTTSTAKDAGK